MAWRCSADAEFKERVFKFINILFLNKTLLTRNIHPDSLTHANKTNFFSNERKSKIIYIDKVTKNIKNFEQARIEKIISKYYEIK